MEAKELTIRQTPCGSSLPDAEVPMINTLVACLGVQHRKLNDLDMHLVYGATRLVSESGSIEGNQKVLQTWDEIRQELWGHLQIEDGLVSWGVGHHALSSTLIDTLKGERQEMRRLMAVLRASSPNKREARAVGDQSSFAETLLALALMLDTHVERYEREVLPSIRRALFPK